MSESFSIARRGFLQLSGAVAGGLALTGCERADPYRIDKPDVPGAAAWLRGEERFVSTACGQCPAGCGVRVRVVEGRAVKIEGNAASPINRGGIGPRGLAGTQALYDPDRLLRPLRRTAPRGASAGTAGFEPVEWETALAELGAGLGALREQGRAHELAILCGRERGLMLELWRRFARSFGTPNLCDGFGTGNGPLALANLLMQGVPEVPAYDWPRARYVLSLGSGMLESSCQMVYFARARGEARRGHAGQRAKVVHVGPVRTRTAINADEYVPVQPQTYGAFALGLAHVLVRDGLHDEAFVRDHAAGFEPWTDAAGNARRGFRAVLADYAPARVARICDVDEKRLERLAHELAQARPSFALAGAEEFRGQNGLGAALAVHALNALLGAIDREGGLLTQRAAPLADLPEVELDLVAEAGLARGRLGAAGFDAPLVGTAVDRWPAAILAGERSPVDTLFVYYANPLYARARPDRWRTALMRVPRVVSFSPVLDETADEFADWILPDLTYLERWEDAAEAPSVGHPVFGLRQPAVPPLGDARATGDVLLSLARELGEPAQAALPWADMKDVVKKRVVGLFNARRGSIVEETGAAFLARLYEEGTWSDPAYEHGRWDEVLRTPSGRFEFHASLLERALEQTAAARSLAVDALLAELGVAEPLEEVCMPRHREAEWSGDPELFPLLLAPYRPSTYCDGGGANLPWLQELRVHAGRPVYATEAEVHPATARAAGLSEGERARVRSPAGAIEVQVHLDAGVREGLVRIAQGGGHTACGRFARGAGANVMQLVDPGGLDPLSGLSPLLCTRVSLERISS